MLTSWKESYDQLDSIFKSRDITLLTKVHLVKAMVLPVVMYGCESWTIKKVKVKEVKVKGLSRVRLFVAPCPVAYKAPPSMGFSRQEYWTGLPFGIFIRKVLILQINLVTLQIFIILNLLNHLYTFPLIYILSNIFQKTLYIIFSSRLASLLLDLFLGTWYFCRH